MFTEHTFSTFESGLNERELQALKRVRYAIVHRFQVGTFHDEATLAFERAELVYQIAACLRLIRPMRQFAMRIQGTIQPDGIIGVNSFDVPIHLMDLPGVQQNFALRNRDVEQLQALANKFLAAIAGEYWKFRIPVTLHDGAHFIGDNWKARMSLLCSAIEAIYTSRDRDHRGSKVSKARIQWFLGENTCIYAPGDVPSFLITGPGPTLGEVLEDLYEVRNCLAHGDKVPDKFFVGSAKANHMSVLEEAASFIVRASLLKILRDDLLQHFRGAAESQTYFGLLGLTNSNLP